MTKAKAKTAEKTPKKETRAVTFKCRICGENKPIEEMRTISRFFPMLVVCQGCEKTLR